MRPVNPGATSRRPSRRARRAGHQARRRFFPTCASRRPIMGPEGESERSQIVARLRLRTGLMLPAESPTKLPASSCGFPQNSADLSGPTRRAKRGTYIRRQPKLAVTGNLNEVNKKRKGSQAFEFISILMVPGRGLEPPRCYPLVPETSASTNSATRAGEEGRAMYAGGRELSN